MGPRSENRGYEFWLWEGMTGEPVASIDLVGIKEYVSFMVTYSELRGDRERCLALTSLTPAEFDFLLPAFVRAYQRRYPADRTTFFRDEEVDGEFIALMKKNGAWQAKTRDEQEGWIRHMNDEHVTPEQVGRMAATAGVKTVVMTHLSPTVDPKDDYQRYVDAAKKFFSGSVLLAKDLMQF